MAKIPIALRLEPDVLSWLDGYAKSRKASRQQVLEAAVGAFKRDAEGGVPDLPVADTPEVRQQRAALKRADPGPAFADANGSRQQRLNAAMLRSRGAK